MGEGGQIREGGRGRQEEEGWVREYIKETEWRMDKGKQHKQKHKRMRYNQMFEWKLLQGGAGDGEKKDMWKLLRRSKEEFETDMGRVVWHFGNKNFNTNAGLKHFVEN